MWLPASVISEVEALAHIRYINATDCERWNKHRRDGELRMLTGWCWTSKDGHHHRQGLKTQTVCIRDCWYELVQHAATPSINRPRLRVITRKAA